MAEQIRQQQLAAALESRLDSQSFTAMQAALLLNNLKNGSSVTDTSSLLAAAAAAASSTTYQDNVTEKQQKPRGRARGKSKQNSRTKNNSVTVSESPQLGSGDKLNKNTVASLLAKSRELSGSSSSTRPELTIEPIFRSSSKYSAAADNDQFDSSDSGRRFQSVMEDGKLKIKTISDSPEIRNLSDHEDGYESDEYQSAVSSSMEQLHGGIGDTPNDGTESCSFKTQMASAADAASIVTSSSTSQQTPITSQPTPCSNATSATTTTNNSNSSSMFSHFPFFNLTL